MSDCDKHYQSHEEERRHHQTAPMKAFSPSVLVTAPSQTPPLAHAQSPPSTSTSDQHQHVVDTTSSTTRTGATPMLRHGAGEDIQKSPVLAFARSHAAGVSSSNRGSPRSQSPTNDDHKAKLVLDSELAAVAINNLNPLTRCGGDGGAESAAGCSESNHALNSSSSQCLEEYVAMNQVEDRSKQLKPLTVAKSPRGK